MVLIAVHGSATRLLAAERATVRLALEVEHDDRATAVEQVGALHERFVAEAEAFVVAGAATWWGSEQVRVRSERRFDARDDSLRLTQFASTEVRVRFQDFTALSAWLVEAGSVGGVSMDRIEWAVTREHHAQVERELRVEAVHDAIRRAEAYASAIGGADVVLRSMWEAGLRPEYGVGESRWAAQAESVEAARPGLELRADDIRIGAAITADFEVG